MTARNGKVKEIWGREFRLVKDGLDESDVFSFIGGLIEQNQELATKVEHVSSLRRLAERAVVQAAKEAGRIKQEAEQQAAEAAASIAAQGEEQARAEAARIIAEAERSAEARIAASEQEAHRLLAQAEREVVAQADRILAEAHPEARAKAETIIAEAELEATARAQKILADAGEAARAHAESVVAEVERDARTSAEEMVSAAESQAMSILQEAEEKARAARAPAAAEADSIIAEAQQSIEAAQRKAREILAEAEEQAGSIRSMTEQDATTFVEEFKQKADHATEVRIANAEEEGRRIIEESIRTARLEAERITQEAEDAAFGGQPYEQEDDLRAKFEVLLDLLVSNSLGSRERVRPAVLRPERAPIEQPSQPRMSVPEMDDVADDDLDVYHGPVQLDFPPPLNSGQVLKIHKALAKIPQVRVLDLEGSSRGGIRIKAYVTGHVPLVDVLREMPEVGKVSDGVRPAASRNSRDGAKSAGPRRIVVSTRS